MLATQIEFPLQVAVCAWCNPKERSAVVGVLSHGICLRHLKKLKLEARGLIAKSSRRRRRQPLPEPENAAEALPLLAGPAHDPHGSTTVTATQQ
jgi:hypothetical protein